MMLWLQDTQSSGMFLGKYQEDQWEDSLSLHNQPYFYDYVSLS